MTFPEALYYALTRRRDTRRFVESLRGGVDHGTWARTREMEETDPALHLSLLPRGPESNSIVFGLPASGATTSRFGWRLHPIYHKWRFHSGVDIAGKPGAPIRATGAGKILKAGWRGGSGITVVIDHGGGRTTLYGHLAALYVHEGDHVDAWDMIGAMGSTGVSTGYHVHYEVRQDGRPVDPIG